MVSILSFRILDSDGDPASLPLYFEGSPTLADMQTAATALAPMIDAAIDGKIDSVTVQLGLTLPGGLKANPVANSEVQKGALLSFDAETTPYRWSIFVPSWEAAGFAGNAVVNTGVYATLITALQASYGTGEVPITDKYENDLVGYIEGVKKFRK